jgi:hypothetical protein
MTFKFHDKSVVEAKGEWKLDSLASAWDGLDRLLNELNESYKIYTLSDGNPYELDYNAGHTSLNRSGEVLITNAKDSIHIKRARQRADYHGRIEVNVCASDDLLRVVIEDNGAGIEPEVEPYLFTWLGKATTIPSHLLKKNMDRMIGIDGLIGDDLRQVRENVQGLGGRVFYENKGYNVGAIFGYEVPLSSLRVPQVLSQK